MTCFFRPTNTDEIIKFANKLGSNKSPGYDSLELRVVKKVAKEITYPLMLKLIFNVSLSTRVVPDELKIVKVVPIYKKK